MTTRLKNAVSWFEIPAYNIKRAKAFYESIFEIEISEMTLANDLKMPLFPVEDGTIGGAICEHSRFYHPSHEETLIYLNGNPDLGTILDRVKAFGKGVLIPKTQISPELGYMGVFEDSEGNRIALHSTN